jgi:hypothetical protein
MPHRTWKCTCLQGSKWWSSSPVCQHCGATGKPDGWRYGMYEDMAREQNLYGLKPIGPHKRMTHELFRGLLVGCDACGGRGLLDQPPSYSVCDACRGLRSLFTVPPDVVSGIRQQIVEAFPEAAANPVRDFATAPVIHDLSQGVIASLPRVDPHRDASHELAFQWWGGNEGVFVHRASWDHVTAIQAAIENSRTWGELKRALPEREFEELPLWWGSEGEMTYREGQDLLYGPEEGDPDERLEDFDDAHVISDHDELNSSEIPGYCDGDYPDWMGAIEATTLPETFVDTYGTMVDSRISGSWLQFPVALIEEMTVELAKLGYEVSIVKLESR